MDQIIRILFSDIEKFFTEESLEAFKTMSSEGIVKSNYALDMMIRNILIEPSIHIKGAFISKGIKDIETMSAMVIEQFHQSLND